MLVYESRPARKSMNNRYEIHDDRIELKCRFPFIKKTWVIERDDLVSIEAFRPPVIRTAFWALKLDLADFNEHVGIRRRSGLFKQLRFTPENPREFVERARETFKL